MKLKLITFALAIFTLAANPQDNVLPIPDCYPCKCDDAACGDIPYPTPPPVPGCAPNCLK